MSIYEFDKNEGERESLLNNNLGFELVLFLLMSIFILIIIRRMMRGKLDH